MITQTLTEIVFVSNINRIMSNTQPVGYSLLTTPTLDNIVKLF